MRARPVARVLGRSMATATHVRPLPAPPPLVAARARAPRRLYVHCVRLCSALTGLPPHCPHPSHPTACAGGEQPATKTFANIPGLTLHLGAASPEQQASLIADTLALRRRVVDAVDGKVGNGEGPIVVKVPQPIRSEYHNLAEEKSFYRVKVADLRKTPSRTLNCEHFPDYGSSGHTLSYFQRKGAIPSYIQRDVIDRFVGGMPEVAAVAQQAGSAPEELAYGALL